MSELKVYHCNEWHNEYTEFYMKSEADKVIAELKEKITQYKVLYKEKCRDINNQERHFAKQLYHHKYKRCLANAERCKDKIENAVQYDEHDDWLIINEYWERWHERWIALAEKFKEAKR